ncbi:MAG: glucose-6-phosphate isomerase [Acholeplasmatales bacterium]|jgi:glucose-6-phosphate isomerase|nr:glucose-6-phosphate isomerase [Acholeplasmatales bacterium]
MINIEYKYDPTINEKIDLLKKRISENHSKITNKNGLGSEFLGWLDLPKYYKDSSEFNEIIKAGDQIKKDSQVLVVIGIGGSYLGAKAGYEMFKNPFKTNGVEVIFAGHQLSSKYLNNLTEYLMTKDFSINVISKSGTTTEPAISFRILKNLLEEKYKDKAYQRIYATTDEKKGALHNLSIENKYKTFVVPDNIGGRFSVLTAVGLLPLYVGGININDVLDGALEALNDFSTDDVYKNPAYYYAVIRYLLYKSGKKVEILANYEPEMAYFSEWWKQLFGESEGKDLQGLFVSSVNFTTDLHSMGQYIQEGERILFETVIKVKDHSSDLLIPKVENDIDELNYLAGKKLSYINNTALEATLIAHEDGQVPNIKINLDEISHKSFGYLVYFFELSCAMSAYLLNVNPFNQPGVEAYKKKMFNLLGKKGY